MKKNWIIATLSALAASGGAFAQVGNDNCATPTPIMGDGIYNYDLGAATASNQGWLVQCLPGINFMGRDVWYCWTATCTGMVEISTCGLTQGDTLIAIYPDTVGCQCPGDAGPLCCNDNFCDKQSYVTCEVVCGRRYLIQVGTRPNDPGFPGQVRISCDGKPCGDPPVLTAPECGTCCGARPPIVDSLTTPFAAGQVAVATEFHDNSVGAAVMLVDIGDQSAAPVGGPPLANWNTQRYSHPNWSVESLGTVFGVTFDGSGNIFAAHTVVYPGWFMDPDPVGYGGVGAIYRLDGANGATSVLKNLPQQLDPSLPAPTQYPGVGQLDFDCSRNIVVASNFEDGRIYSINAASGAVHAYDFATGNIAGPMNGTGMQLAEAGDPVGAAPLGERVWAVKVAGDRVYYSVWGQDSCNSNGGANTIRSVELTAAGAFVAGTDRLELVLPPLAGYGFSNPVADISFDDECCMLVSERSMCSVSESSAHSSRSMRFCFDSAAGAWAAPTVYGVGLWSQQTNSAGGVDFVLGSNGPQIWSISDAVQLNYPNPTIYGLTSAPIAGGDSTDGPNVDLDGDLVGGQKYQLGSLDITCWETQNPCEFTTEDIDCKLNDDGTFSFVWTVTLTNNSPVPANILILPDDAFAPNNVILLNPPLQQGESTSLDIVINAGEPGSTFCFGATLAGSTGDECCTTEICIDLPECRCFESDEYVQDLPGIGSFSFGLTMTNISTTPAFTAQWLTFAVAPGYPGTSVNPTLLNIGALPVGSSISTIPVTVTTALPPGSLIKIIVGMHSSTFHPCCFREIDVYVPADLPVSVPGDINGDGTVDAADLSVMLANWGMGGPADLNDDGTTDAADLAILLANWG